MNNNRDELISKAIKVMESEFIAGEGKYNSSLLIKDYCRLQLGAEKEEVFGMIFMNSQLELLAFEKMFRGSITETHVPPRAIARRMFELNASKMILVHNHPPGNVKPSNADLQITKQLKDLFNQLDCHIVDHIIVSPIDVYSMYEKGDM